MTDPTPSSTDSRCWNRRCTAVGKMRCCSGCKKAFYCSTECQQANWATHRRWCTPASAAALNHRLAMKYYNEHRSNYSLLALENLGFFSLYHRLRGVERLKFLETNGKFLHVILKRVDSPGLGVHNKLKFAAAVSRPISDLEAADSLPLRLISCFPAVLIGFTVYDPLGYRETHVITVAHTFKWPALCHPRVHGDMITDAIAASEDALQERGKILRKRKASSANASP